MRDFLFQLHTTVGRQSMNHCREAFKACGSVDLAFSRAFSSCETENIYLFSKLEQECSLRQQVLA